MRKVVAGLFMSLDGVVESPSSWAIFDEQTTAVMAAGIQQADAILLGRRTYLEFASLWPGQASETPMAHFMNATPKHVVSATLSGPLDWANSYLVSGDLAEQVAALRAQPGRNIQVPGSPALVQSLLRAGLLDELSLMIQPIVLGAGQRLFGELPDRLRLRLVESTTFRTGVLSVTYQPAR